MNGINRKKIGILFLLFLLVAVYQDCTSGNLKKDYTILRDEEKEKQIHLVLEGEGVLSRYDYELEIQPISVTKEQADVYFSEAISSITEDFQIIEEKLLLSELYVDGKVEAEWNLGNIDCIDSEGNILQEYVPEGGMLVNAQVILSCGNYEQIYGFSFQIEKKALSRQELLLQSIQAWIDRQMMQEGTNQIELPMELEGISLKWSEKREYMTFQVLFLELIAVIFLWWGGKRQLQQDEKKRIRNLEFDYPDLVNQLSMLLETGMTIRQAWTKIASQYELKQKMQPTKKSFIYEQIVYMNRRLSEGENERVVYQKFAEEINVRCYYQLMRTLSTNLEKGTAGLCVQLEEECRRAYEQKILMAKKIGEEASTKMLVPLMSMMFLVMAIVLLPAILGMTI